MMDPQANAALHQAVSHAINEPVSAELAAAYERIAELEKTLEPFADVDGEGDEDFSDDTPCVLHFGRTTHFALELSHFRRARAALNDTVTS